MNLSAKMDQLHTATSLKSMNWPNFNSRSVYLDFRSQMAFNLNLGLLIMYEWQFTKWSINYLDNWRLCVFYENIIVLIFWKKILIIKKNLWTGSEKNSKTFFLKHYSPKMITWPFIQGIRLVKVVLVFFRKLLKSIFEKKWSGSLEVFKIFFHYIKVQNRSRDLQIYIPDLEL
jgi:hypothetical protein